MNRVSESGGCPMGYTDVDHDGEVLSTNWEYLQTMKMNEFAPAANLWPVTRPGARVEGRRFVPWFWPDDELAPSVELRKKIFLDGQDRVLDTANNDPVVRAASQQLLWLQANYLHENFPNEYQVEQSRKFGRIIVNKVTDDQFAVRPDSDDWHPLAISGLLGQEDICIVQRQENRHVFVAGFLATPTNWNLAAFINADMDEIHQNVDGYHTPASHENSYRLKDTVDKTLDNLREYPDGLVGRNNQFTADSPLLSLEPGTYTPAKLSEIAKNPAEHIYLRSERETLTRLPAPYDDFTVFTIKPNVFRMSDVARERGEDFARALATNAVLHSSLRSSKQTKPKNAYDLVEPLRHYLTGRSDSTHTQ